MSIRNNVQLLVLGKQGSGKSTMARLMLATHALGEKRDLYISVSSKRDHIDPPLPGAGPQYEVFLHRLGFEPFAVTDELMEDGFDIERVLDRHPRAMITLMGTSPEATDCFMSDLGDLVLEWGHAVLLVDEAEKFLPRTGRRAEGMLDLLRRARYRGVDLMMVSHTDTALHHEAFESANMLMCFGIKSPTRIERLSYWFEDPNVLSDLQPFEYVLVDEVSHKKIRRFSRDDFEKARREHPELFRPVPRSEIRAACPQLFGEDM